MDQIFEKKIKERAEEINSINLAQWLVLAIFLGTLFMLAAGIAIVQQVENIAKGEPVSYTEFGYISGLLILMVLGFCAVFSLLIHRSGLFKGMLEAAALYQHQDKELSSWEKFKNNSSFTSFLAPVIIFCIAPPIICVVLFLFGISVWYYLGHVLFGLVVISMLIINVAGIVLPPKISKDMQCRYREKLKAN